MCAQQYRGILSDVHVLLCMFGFNVLLPVRIVSPNRLRTICLAWIVRVPSVRAETDPLKVTVERLRLELQELNADRARLQREATAWFSLPAAHCALMSQADQATQERNRLEAPHR